MSRLRVFIAEGSSLAERAIRGALARAPDIEVVGFAADGALVPARVRETTPSVVLLSLDLHRDDGWKVLPRIMADDPRPVIMMLDSSASDFTEREHRLLRMGAVAVFPRPGAASLIGDSTEHFAMLAPTIRRAARVKVVRVLLPGASAVSEPPAPALRTVAGPTPLGLRPRESSPMRMIVIGSSTGGPTALVRVLRPLPSDFPLPIAIAQHMPEGFTTDLARYLDNECALTVAVARDGERPQPGHVYLAPGRQNLTFRARTSFALSPVVDSMLENIPSVDVLFRSAAEVFGDAVMAVVLTGMGRDGAEGVRAIRASGGRTLSQDEQSSMIYGMPREAFATGCVDVVAPLDEVHRHIEAFATPQRRDAEAPL